MASSRPIDVGLARPTGTLAGGDEEGAVVGEEPAERFLGVGVGEGHVIGEEAWVGREGRGQRTRRGAPPSLPGPEIFPIFGTYWEPRRDFSPGEKLPLRHRPHSRWGAGGGVGYFGPIGTTPDPQKRPQTHRNCLRPIESTQDP